MSVVSFFQDLEQEQTDLSIRKAWKNKAKEVEKHKHVDTEMWMHGLVESIPQSRQQHATSCSVPFLADGLKQNRFV